MDPIFSKGFIVLITILFSPLFLFYFADASISEEVYKASLKIAEKKVIRNKEAKSRSQSFSVSLTQNIVNKPYQIGDNWLVATWSIRSSMMRMTDDPDKTKTQLSEGTLLKYEVIGIGSEQNPKISLRVTPVKASGFNSTDSTIQVPLEIPNIDSAEKRIPTEFPQLPAKIQETVSRIGIKTDLSKSYLFEDDDFYGRPVQLLWQKGEPWPSYMKTSSGIFIRVTGET